MNAQTNLWAYVPAWMRLVLWELARGDDGLARIRGEMDGKHYNLKLR